MSLVSSTPKSKPQFKIVFSPSSDITQNVKGVRLAKAKPGGVTPLQAAINSITNDGEISSQLGKALGSQKFEKIVFTPKQIKNTVPNNVKASTSKIDLSKVVADAIGAPATKKRKLGDLALGTWKKEEPVAEERVVETPAMLCRICGSFVEETPVHLVDDSGTLTKMGSKLKTIVGNEINESPLYPPACCKACSFKVNVCFSLLIELQASNEVVKSTYEELQDGDVVCPNQHIYNCQECQKEVIGMKNYISHCETHMQEKTIGADSVEDEANKEPEEGAESAMLSVQVYLEEEQDDGTITFQNEFGEYVCASCERTFKYLFLLQLHKKAPKRAFESGKVCFVCKQARPSTVACKLGDNTIPICEPCRTTVSFMVV